MFYKCAYAAVSIRVTDMTKTPSSTATAESGAQMFALRKKY